MAMVSQTVFSRSGGVEHPEMSAYPQSPVREQPAVKSDTASKSLPKPLILDSLTLDSLVRADSIRRRDSLLRADTLRREAEALQSDTLLRPAADSVPIYRKPFLDDVINGENEDSLVYQVQKKVVYIYEKGDVKYQKMNLKADFMRIDMDHKEIYAYGRPDTVELEEPTEEGDTVKIVNTRPEFIDEGASYTMDTITYNLDSKKARIKGVATQEGEGYIQGVRVKKMPDNTINIANGRYTTCDAENPHFYMAMTKSKTIPGKKSVFGPTYLVMEDVPIYFLGLPFGFFPISNTRKSGFLIPSYGEETVKGFFLRDGGYYFTIKDYADVAVTGGFYTMGSWEADVASRYVKRYKYRGSFDINFSKDIIGEKGDADYINQNNFRVTWSHQQDPKFKPNSTFSASVNFSTSGYNKYAAQNMNDYLSSQTNSSISYSHTWSKVSLSMNLQHSQNSRDLSVQLSFPNIVLNVSRINPFQRKNPVGKQRWYEKISLQYTGTFGNTVSTKEKDLFTDKMFKGMRSGINHQIPIQTSFNLLKYININPSINYQERWYFQKIEKEWDPVAKQVVDSDTTWGFYRLYNYSMSVSATTKIYGTYLFKKKDGLIRAIRHMITPSISFSYTPDFGKNGYGYYKQVQSDTTGHIMTYSPFQNGLYGIPSSGPNMSMSFGISQTLEAKVRDRRDTSGVRKIKLIDNFSINSSYNFLADSLNLAPFSLSLRTTLTKNVALNVSATLDPYQVDPVSGNRINRFMIKKGSLARLTSVQTSFGYSFNSGKSSSSGQPAMNDINSGMNVPVENADMFAQPGFTELDPNTRRMMMASRYYDFSIPWNLGLNYSFSYTNTGNRKSVVQTLGFNGSLNLTPKWGVTFNGGYDFVANKLTPGTVTLTRDLHCWQMSFMWVPIGFRKSWSFTIGVKAATLRDLKYDRRNSFYDNLYDQY